MNYCVADTTITSLLLQNLPEILLYKPHFTGVSIHISFQTVAEMRYGALRNGWGMRRKRELESFLLSFAIVEYSSELADCWATVMHESRIAGRRLEVGDAWIAAAALSLNAPLLTHDRDFKADACPSIQVYCYAGA